MDKKVFFKESQKKLLFLEDMGKNDFFNLLFHFSRNVDIFGNIEEVFLYGTNFVTDLDAG